MSLSYVVLYEHNGQRSEATVTVSNQGTAGTARRRFQARMKKEGKKDYAIKDVRLT